MSDRPFSLPSQAISVASNVRPRKTERPNMPTAVLTCPTEGAIGHVRLDRERRATEYWIQYIRSVAEPLLKLTGSYTQSEQDAHLRFLDSYVAPVLGPIPTEPHGVYTMPYAGSPVEFTITSTSVGKPKAHIQFEFDRPSNREEDDPFGEANGREVLRRIASHVGADTRWLECLISSLHLTPDEIDITRPLVPPSVPSVGASISFDGPRKIMRTYFVPGLKALATRRMPSAVGLDAVRRLQPLQGGLEFGVDLLEE